jgi:hypothetical protein
MSFTEILNEIPTLTLQERQTLLQALQKQQYLEKARAFAAEFEGITEITIHTPLELIER